MQCARCAADNPADHRFCEACGGQLQLACAECGLTLRAGARFCGRCGSAVRIAPSEPAAPVARLGEGGERKHVTILFADIRDSTELIRALDPEQAIEQLDPALTAMKQAVRRYGGTVNRVQGDGIMAMFGVPVAQEDHAANACLAARAMIMAVEKLGPSTPQIRIGIHSGTVVVRPTGNDPSDWDAVGVAAHLAARMEAIAAPGTACLSADTARLAFGFVDAVSLGMVPIRGATDLEVFRLISAVERPSWEVRAGAHPLTRFVGRGSELAMLLDAMHRVGLGRGQAVTIRGEAGMGKSRLVQEFLLQVPPGWRVLRVGASAHETGTPFSFAAGFVRVWLGLDSSSDPTSVERRLNQALSLGDRRLPAEAAPLRALLDLPESDAGWTGASPQQRRHRIEAALRLLLLVEAQARPVVAVVEDRHWVDAASHAALVHAVGAIAAARVMLIATTRPTEANDAMAGHDGNRQHGGRNRGERSSGEPSWGEQSWCSVLPLAPLRDEDAQSVLRELVGDAAELAPLRRQIAAETEGTPLFLEEMARALFETGVVSDQPARRILTRPLADVVVPESVKAVLAGRIDRLPPQRRAVLQVASVVGRDVPLDLLRDVAGLPDEVLRGELSALGRSEFLFEVDLPTGTEYTFKHALTHAVAYDGILRRTRRELHGRVLALLEREGDAAAGVERLVHHALRGEAWEPASRYALAAGLRANARSAWREARVFLEQALTALAALPTTVAGRRHGIEVRLALRVALGPLGELAAVARMLEEARELAVILDDTRRLAPIDVNACLILTNLGRLPEALEAGRRSLRSALDHDDGACVLGARFALGQALWFEGDFAEAERVFSAALPELRSTWRLHDAGTTGTASVLLLVGFSKAQAIVGRIEPALHLAEEAAEIAAETRRPYDVSYAAIARGYAEFVAGRELGAVEPLERALESARSAEIALLIPSVARYLGRAYAACGRLAEAEALIEEALAITAPQALVGLTAWCNLALAEVRLAQGCGAEAPLQAALTLAERHGYRPAAAQAHRLFGESHRAAGRNDEAIASFRLALDMAASLGMRPEAARARHGLATTRGSG